VEFAVVGNDIDGAVSLVGLDSAEGIGTRTEKGG
jgi:hypothetical protein